MLLGARDVVGGIDWCKEQKDNENISKDMEKAKKKFAGHEIRGKKLGVIGLGAIGAEVANAAQRSAWKYTAMTRLFLSKQRGCFPET